MFHRLLVVQKIDDNAKLDVNYVDDDNISWTYETRRDVSTSDALCLFPIKLNKSSHIIHNKTQNDETLCIRENQSTISFSDDYGVPEGTVICITGPKWYAPSVVRVKDPDTVSFNNFKHEVPAHFELKSNVSTKESSVIIKVLRNSVFSVNVEFTKVEESYKFLNKRTTFDSNDITLNVVKNKLELFNKNDLENESVNKEIIDMLAEIFELIKMTELSTEEAADTSEIESKYTALLVNLIASGSSIVTLVDSYNNAGVVSDILGLLGKMFA